MIAPGSKRKILRWVPSLLWAGLIFYLSSQSGVHLPGTDFLFKDKFAHFFAYGVLCAFVMYGCDSLKEADHARGIGLLAVIAYGFLDEIHQKFVPGRLCDPIDFVADSTAAIGYFGLIVLRAGSRKRRGNEIQITKRDSRHTA